MKKIDYFLLSLVIFLTLFGLFMIYDASSFISFRDFGSKYHYIKDQSLWMTLGFIGLGVFSVLDYHKLYNAALPFLIVSIILLVLVFLPGVGASFLGAHRWINARIFILQPAEFVKLSLALYLSAWFSSKEKGRLGAFLLLLGLVLGFVILEPDMGTASIILGESLVVYFLQGAQIFHFVVLIPILSIIGFIFIKLEPYRAARFSTFLNPDLQSSSYHVRQILIALGMGGITGVGIGNSIQKYAYLPENVTDSIFAIIAEEMGFIGATILIIVFVLFVWRGFIIANRARDLYGKLLAGAIISFLGIQIIINLGAQTALVPLTGVPLPFISYGGSSLVIDLCSVGILLNISKQAV